MTKNIEQRTLAATSTIETSAKAVDEIAHTDNVVDTPVGKRKSFPRISREWGDESSRLQKDWNEESERLKNEWRNDSAIIREDWSNERNELSVKANGIKLWSAGETESNLNQQRRWSDNQTYLPKTVPALMTEVGPDDNWVLFSADKFDTLTDVFGRKPVVLIAGTVLNPDSSEQYPKISAFGKIWELDDASSPLTVKSFLQSTNGYLIITLNDDTQVIANNVYGASREWVSQGVLKDRLSYNLVRTVKNKLDETVSIKDFGAKGDGVTDDTDAIQAAVDYVSQNNVVSKILIPSGTYLISKYIDFTKYGKYFLIQGEDSSHGCRYKSIIKVSDKIKPTEPLKYMFLQGRPDDGWFYGAIAFRGVTFQADDLAETILELFPSAYSSVKDCAFQKATVCGVHMAFWILTIADNHFNECDKGIIIGDNYNEIPTPHEGAGNLVNIKMNNFSNCGNNIVIESANHVNITENGLDACDRTSIIAKNVRLLNVVMNYVEAPTRSQVDIIPVVHAGVTYNYELGGFLTVAAAVWTGGQSTVNIRDNYIADNQQVANTNCINISGVDRLNVTGNNVSNLSRGNPLSPKSFVHYFGYGTHYSRFKQTDDHYIEFNDCKSTEGDTTIRPYPVWVTQDVLSEISTSSFPENVRLHEVSDSRLDTENRPVLRESATDLYYWNFSGSGRVSNDGENVLISQYANGNVRLGRVWNFASKLNRPRSLNIGLACFNTSELMVDVLVDDQAWGTIDGIKGNSEEPEVSFFSLVCLPSDYNKLEVVLRFKRSESSYVAKLPWLSIQNSSYFLIPTKNRFPIFEEREISLEPVSVDAKSVTQVYVASAIPGMRSDDEVVSASLMDLDGENDFLSVMGKIISSSGSMRLNVMNGNSLDKTMSGKLKLLIKRA